MPQDANGITSHHHHHESSISTPIDRLVNPTGQKIGRNDADGDDDHHNRYTGSAAYSHGNAERKDSHPIEDRSSTNRSSLQTTTTTGGVDGGGGSAHDAERYSAVLQATDAAKNMAILSSGSSSSSAAVKAKATKSSYNPVCEAAAHQEALLSMSTLYHSYKDHFDVPSRLWTRTGTCKVQLLRSIGKWSTGTRTECSIMNCYIESIFNAKHFIYIENQFFVGNTAGEGVYNKIPNAIVERILRAHSQREAFRVIIIIPVHPNGDYSHAMKAKVVMHYEYATINRGLESMFNQLKFRSPAININDYIDFFSLRNWGIINNKVVSEQIYVHDKLIIIDDRVLIIGSANINDRSMLGNRDSELAVRIEDAAHMDIRMNGNMFTVGCVPHRLRVKLMKQHLQCNGSIGKVKIRDSHIVVLKGRIVILTMT